MNYSDYDKSIKTILENPEFYERILFNLKYQSAAKIISIVKKFQKSLLTENAVATLLQSTKNPKDRSFYGLPKTHKSKEKWDTLPPLRPICPDVGTETSMSARLIAFYLSPIMQAIPSYVKNSFELVNLFSKIPTLPATAVILVADVENLYPSLPIRESFNRVVRRLRTIPNLDNSAFEFITKLLEVQLENNCFVYDNVIYKQIKGIPMGKAWAPAVASIYLDEWETSAFNTTGVKPLLYFRYIDDIFSVLKNRNDADVLIECLQNSDPNIRVSEFTIANIVHFLDLNILIDQGRLLTSVYSKPSHLRVLLHFDSAHSHSLKFNVVISQLIRFYKLNSDLVSAGEQMYIFIQLMIQFRNLPRHTARLIWNRFLTWLRNINSPKNFNRYLPISLYVPNNTYTRPFKMLLRNFLDSLTATDREKVGDLRVRERSGMPLGRTLFHT